MIGIIIVLILVLIILAFVFLWNKFYCTPYYFLVVNFINYLKTDSDIDGIAQDDNYIYILTNNSIILHTKAGGFIKKYDYPIDVKFSNCAIANNKLYCANNLETNNDIYVFDITTMKLLGIIKVNINENLKWIDYYNNYFWTTYGNRLVKLNNYFMPMKEWIIPSSVDPYNIKSGAWLDDVLYLTNQKNNKIYLIKIKNNKVLHIYTTITPLFNGDLSWNYQDKHLFGINDQTNQLVKLKLKQQNLDYCMFKITRYFYNLFGSLK